MNFEEMLNAQEGKTPKREKLPLGDFYRKQIDGKYRFVVELKNSLTDSIAFCEALKKEQQWSSGQHSKQQLHFELPANDDSAQELMFEPGSWQTLSQLLFTNPAVIAQKGFVDQLVRTLIDEAAALHAGGVYHLCFAPQTIFLRKGETSPMLLSHGSFYLSLGNQTELYEGVEQFVAPEVLNHGQVDERSDVYSLGQLILYLYDQSALPFEYKPVVKKATAVDPSQRFKSIDEMKAVLAQRRYTKRASIATASAFGIALLCLIIFLEAVPTVDNIEYVQPIEQKEEGDPFDSTYDPESLEEDTMMQSQMDALYQKKAEEILQRRAERENEALNQQEQQHKVPMRSKGVKSTDSGDKNKQE